MRARSAVLAQRLRRPRRRYGGYFHRAFVDIQWTAEGVVGAQFQCAVADLGEVSIGHIAHHAAKRQGFPGIVHAHT